MGEGPDKSPSPQPRPMAVSCRLCSQIRELDFFVFQKSENWKGLRKGTWQEKRHLRMGSNWKHHVIKSHHGRNEKPKEPAGMGYILTIPSAGHPENNKLGRW